MAIVKRTQTTLWRSGIQRANAATFFSAAVRPLRTAAAWLVGSSIEGPRASCRPGWPEHELMGIISGRRDRFDGLM